MLEILVDKLHLGYKDYEISIMPPEDREKNIGYHMPQLHTIQIAVDLRPSEVINTLLHEIIHAIYDNAAYRFKNQEEEENVVNCTANGLTQVFADNKDLVLWMVTHCQRNMQENTSKVLSNTTSTDT